MREPENNGPDTHFFRPCSFAESLGVLLAANVPVKALFKSQSAWQEELCGSLAALSICRGGKKRKAVDWNKFSSRSILIYSAVIFGFRNLNPCLAFSFGPIPASWV